MPPAQSSRAGVDCARPAVLSPAKVCIGRSLTPALPQLPKMGSEKMSFTVTTTININTSAIPVR